MFWQRMLDRDLLCHVWVDDCTYRMSERPCINVKYVWQIVFLFQIVDQYVRMDVWWEARYELAHSHDVAEDEIARGHRLGEISVVLSLRRGSGYTKPLILVRFS